MFGALSWGAFGQEFSFDCFSLTVSVFTNVIVSLVAFQIVSSNLVSDLFVHYFHSIHTFIAHVYF